MRCEEEESRGRLRSQLSCRSYDRGTGLTPRAFSPGFHEEAFFCSGCWREGCRVIVRAEQAEWRTKRLFFFFFESIVASNSREFPRNLQRPFRRRLRIDPLFWRLHPSAPKVVGR